jgi:hypothetical protein
VWEGEAARPTYPDFEDPTPKALLSRSSMNEGFETSVQLIAFAAFIAATVTIVATSLTSIATECLDGMPVLPTIFVCFPPR